MSHTIFSIRNPVIKNLLLLEEKPRARKEQNLIVIEGVREISMAVQSGFLIDTLFCCKEILNPDFFGNLNPGVSPGTVIFEVTSEVFNRIAYRKDHGGIMALAHPKRISFTELILPPVPLILVLETVEKPGNLGAILRTSDAASLDAVIICDPQTDIYNPNAIRSSIGSVFTLPVITASSEETIAFLRSKNIRIFATSLNATQPYHQTNLCQPLAIIMGSEAFGISARWLDEADTLIKIPMFGKIDSMNVSTSAAVVVFEALRQRIFQ